MVTRRVVVSGAGIAGLAAALTLHRAGWEVLVVERAAARRSSGYMVNVLGKGYDAVERLGILPELVARDVGTFTSILTRADGREKLTVPAALAETALGKRAITVFRGDLESALYDAVHDLVEFRFGTTVESVVQHAQGVELTLSDGRSTRADLLIGADGLHSGVRETVFGPEPEFRRDLGLVVAAFPLQRIPRAVPESSGTTFIGPGRTAAVINLGTKWSAAFFTYRTVDPTAELVRGPADALTATFGDLGGGVNDALNQLGADTIDAYFDSVSQVVMEDWSRGRVVLLGDAAWCVTLFGGYGAALAIMGAEQLGAALAEHGDDVPSALIRWETRLRPEIDRRQALARKGINQYAPSTRAHVWLRDVMLRAIRLPGIRSLFQYAVQRSNR